MLCIYHPAFRTYSSRSSEYMDHGSFVWWHTGESEFENNSTSEREQYLIWERYKISWMVTFSRIKLIKIF
ncbi:MAG: hypothetical protein MUO21_04520 [Nitrososphaeraceae archaeon]|nr:hypothetical protein [Nitrososphaeraceae archaeon]